MKTARRHYENFPVASFFIPATLRKHVASVYAFARYADDIADEGNAARQERRLKLDDWRAKLHRSVIKGENHPIFIALSDTIRRFDLPLQLFDDLLDAFAQDIMVDEYETFDQLLDYCRRSANPIGRILLYFFHCSSSETVAPADALCTGLQLANFWQDVAVDVKKNRIYVPKQDRMTFDVPESDLYQNHASEQLRLLMQCEVARTRIFFHDAQTLFAHVPFRLRLELKAIWQGGMKILHAIEMNGFDTLAKRPSLRFADKMTILLSALLPVSNSEIEYARN